MYAFDFDDDVVRFQPTGTPPDTPSSYVSSDRTPLKDSPTDFSSSPSNDDDVLTRGSFTQDKLETTVSLSPSSPKRKPFARARSLLNALLGRKGGKKKRRQEQRPPEEKESSHLVSKKFKTPEKENERTIPMMTFRSPVRDALLDRQGFPKFLSPSIERLKTTRSVSALWIGLVVSLLGPDGHYAFLQRLARRMCGPSRPLLPPKSIVSTPSTRHKHQGNQSKRRRHSGLGRTLLRA